MARKNRSLAGFDQVANNNKVNNINDNNNNKYNINDNVNNNVNININENINNNIDNSDYIDSLISGNKRKKEESVLVGIYFPKQVADILDRLAKNGGRGAKSKIVVEAVKKVFREKDLL